MSIGVAALVAGSVLVYLIVAGVTWAIVPGRWRDSSYGSDHNGEPAVIAALFWPLILPVVAGVAMARSQVRK